MWERGERNPNEDQQEPPESQNLQEQMLDILRWNVLAFAKCIVMALMCSQEMFMTT